MEIWRFHPDEPYLLVSTEARFMRCDTVEYLELRKHGKYKAVTFNGRTFLVHVAVLEAHVGPRPAGNVARHGPNGRDDNTLENLSWGTYADNWRDAVRDGTQHIGDKHQNARLRDEDIRAIYLARHDVEVEEVAEAYDISPDYARAIQRLAAPRAKRVIKV